MDILLNLWTAALIATGNKPAEPPHASKVAFQYTYEKQERLKVEAEKAKVKRGSTVASSRQAPVKAGVSGLGGDGVWDRLAQCEAGGDPTKNTGNGFYGMFQFSAPTWNSMRTGYARADLAPASVQTAAAQKLQARSGWGQWPGCSRKLGLT